MAKVDRVYVLGDYVKRVLQSRGMPLDRIVSTGLPRFSRIYKYRHPGKNLDPGGKFKIMTLTQSAVWHNDRVKEEVQKAQLLKFIDLVDNLRKKTGRDIEIHVRLHPRDLAADRSYFFEKSFVRLLKGDLYEQLVSHDLVVATSSTVLVETLAINGRVAVMMLVDQWWRYKRSFLSLPCFHKFHSEETLEKYVMHLIDGGEFERYGLDMLISPQCRDAASAIARDMLKELAE